MKENKVVIVKTRGGKILRLMKEHYLRDDIEHGIGSALDSSPENRPNSFCSRVGEWLIIIILIFGLLAPLDSAGY